MTTINGCVVKVCELDLTAGGLPGLVFSGSLEIEPDHTVCNEDWFIFAAVAENAKAVYDRKTNPVIFAAIAKTVEADLGLLAEIEAAVREG